MYTSSYVTIGDALPETNNHGADAVRSLYSHIMSWVYYARGHDHKLKVFSSWLHLAKEPKSCEALRLDTAVLYGISKQGVVTF